MESNRRKKHSHRSSRSKGSRSGSDADGEPRIRERNEKKSLFQIGGGIPTFEDFNDHLKDDDDGMQISMGSTSSSSSPSPSSSTSSDDMIELKAKQETKSQDNKTRRFQVSAQAKASAWLPPLSPTKSPPLQVMERGYDPHRIPSSIFEKSEALDWSVASNESLFSLRIGDNILARDQDISLARVGDISLARDHAFSFGDFKAEELVKSGELLAYCPSLSIHLEDSAAKTSDPEEEEEEERDGGAVTVMEIDSEEKSSMPILLSWGHLSELDNSDLTLSHSKNSDQRPTSSQSFSSPEAKKTKATTKNIKKKKKKRCCCCCKNTRTCPCCGGFSCWRWPEWSCDNGCFPSCCCCCCCRSKWTATEWPCCHDYFCCRSCCSCHGCCYCCYSRYNHF